MCDGTVRSDHRAAARATMRTESARPVDHSPILQTLLSPPILFFGLGLLATWIRSDLMLPPAIAKGLSVYLLVAIGFHGGVELSRSGLDAPVVATLVVAVIGSAVMPLGAFAVLRRRLSTADAAAIAACYGSVSAVTFITAVSVLERSGIAYGGHMVAAMALMESPAIVVGVLLARWSSARSAVAQTDAAISPLRWRSLAHDAFANGAILLLLGSLTIGALTGERGWEATSPLLKDPFQGLLCLFLLDMGIVAARRLGDLRIAGVTLVVFAALAPIVQGLVGLSAAWALGLPRGDALLLAILFGSASYIAAPAAIRMALPQANPSLFVPMSLGVTFPVNITIGIPMHLYLIELWWSP